MTLLFARLGFAPLIVLLLTAAALRPAAAAPEGTLTWGVHVTLAAINERLPGRIGTARASRVLTRIEGQGTGLDHNDHRSGVAVPSGVATRSNHDLLHDWSQDTA